MSKTKERKIPNLGSSSPAKTVIAIIEALLFIAAGILAICYSGDEKFQTTIIMIVGIILILSGAVKIIINFLPILRLKAENRTDLQYTMVVGGTFELALGISLVVLSSNSTAAFNSIVLFLANFIGIDLLVAGAALIAFAIGFLVRKIYPVYLPVLQIVLGVIAIVLGSLVIAYMSEAKNFIQVVLIIVGILLTLVGILIIGQICMKAYVRHLEKKAEKEAAKQEAAAKSPAASTEVVVSDVVEGTAAEAEPKDVIDGTAEEKDPPSVEGPAAIDEKKDE